MTIVTAQELEDRYPDLTPKEREHTFVREHHTTFIIGIGGALRSGKPHDGRSPDYDDSRLRRIAFFKKQGQVKSHHILFGRAKLSGLPCRFLSRTAARIPPGPRHTGAAAGTGTYP